MYSHMTHDTMKPTVKLAATTQLTLAVFQNSLSALKIYSARNVNYTFSALASLDRYFLPIYHRIV